jgi:hypothetical protein
MERFQGGNGKEIIYLRILLGPGVGIGRQFYFHADASVIASHPRSGVIGALNARNNSRVIQLQSTSTKQ